MFGPQRHIKYEMHILLQLLNDASTRTHHIVFAPAVKHVQRSNGDKKKYSNAVLNQIIINTTQPIIAWGRNEGQNNAFTVIYRWPNKTRGHEPDSSVQGHELHSSVQGHEPDSSVQAFVVTEMKQCSSFSQHTNIYNCTAQIKVDRQSYC